MKIIGFILTCLCAVVCPLAAQSLSPSQEAGQAPEAWLGVQLAKPDPSMFAHLPDLPVGMGFLVTSVNPGGPADQNGMKAFDVIWQFDSQMLVNEGQLAALLRLRSPGDTVTISGFRGGKATDFSIVLGKAPQDQKRLMASMIDSTLLPDGVVSVPTRIVRVNAKVASYATEEGQMDVTKSSEGYLVRVTGVDGSSLFQGVMDQGGEITGLSAEWVRRAHALRRGLDHQLEADSAANMVSRSRMMVPGTQPTSQKD